MKLSAHTDRDYHTTQYFAIGMLLVNAIPVMGWCEATRRMYPAVFGSEAKLVRVMQLCKHHAVRG